MKAYDIKMNILTKIKHLTFKNSFRLYSVRLLIVYRSISCNSRLWNFDEEENVLLVYGNMNES